MNTIVIYVGAPCAGKTRSAQRLLAAEGKCARVNRDDYRYMLRNQGLCSNDIEKAITKMQYDTIDSLLDIGYDVIIDNTHCKVSYIKDITNRYKDRAYIHVTIFEEPKVKLKIRNVLRYLKTGKWIPPHVIDRMHKGVKEVKTYVEAKNQQDGDKRTIPER